MHLLTILVVTLSILFTASAVNEQWDAYLNHIQGYKDQKDFRQQWSDHIKLFSVPETQKLKGNPMFKCATNKSSSVPTSVNRLKAGDIKVVGALGDSITAGFGILAVTAVGILLQDRGHSFSVGGYGTYSGGVITLPNILKQYNSELYGYSLGEGTVDSNEAMFNVAIGGSRAPDLLEQADLLVDRMTADSGVNMAKDWKMVTIFIGGNDLCRVCDDQDYLGPAAFIRNMESTLDKLIAGLPRAIVNVVPIMDITPLPGISSDLICDAIQEVVCPCAVDFQYHDELKKAQSEYSSYTAALINSGKYERDDFTVVFQPFLRDTKPPKDANGDSDLSYFAPDCFHFSERGHQALARNLWNSLFVPIGRKATSMTFQEEVTCPSPGAFIATNKNSQSQDLDVKNDRFVDVMAVHELPAVSGGNSHSLTIGVAVVGSVCGLLLVVVVSMLWANIRRKQAQSSTSPIQMS